MDEEEGPARALDFGSEEAHPDLPVVEVHYTEMPKAFDLAEGSDIPLDELVLVGDRIIFKTSTTYISTSIDALKNELRTKTSVFYECKRVLPGGAPYEADVVIETPYFRLKLAGNFMIPEHELQAAISSRFSIFEIVPNPKTLPAVASYNVVQTTPGVNRLGANVDIIGADHCQAGTQTSTHSLQAVSMVSDEPEGGKKRRGKKKTYRKSNGRRRQTHSKKRVSR